MSALRTGAEGIDNNTGGGNKPRESVTYTYDDWSRLQRAQTNDLSVAPTGQPKAWALTWDYDRYGNRKNQNLVGGNLEVTAPQLSISTASNRITTTGYAYDANGNLTSDSLHNYTYDAENRLVTVDSTAASYAYDGNGIRVKRTTGSSVRTIVFSGSKPIAEYLGASLRREYIYAASQLLVRLDTSGSTTTTTYSHPDHLSARLETNTSGVVTRNFGHLPFGDIWYETGTIEKFKFTSYERDTESQLDYATFRFDSSRLGRFMSADPLAGSAASPQSLNRYSYVSNDPVNLGDSLGLGADGFFNCLLDGFLAPCGLGGTALAAGAADALPAGLSTVGFMNGYAYFLTAIDNGIGGTAFPINYWGISPSTAAFELGLPTTLSQLGTGTPQLTPSQIFAQAEEETLRRLKDPKCKKAFGGKGAARIKGTQYSARNASFFTNIGKWEAATTGPRSVVINLQSTFYSYTPNTGARISNPLDGQTWDLMFGRNYNSFILLHELAHQLSNITHAVNDTNNSTAQLANNLWVLQNCF